MRVVTAIAAIQQARRIQPLLRKSGDCLDDLAGWEPGQHGELKKLITTVKPSGKRLTFECDQRARKFLVEISFPRDDFGYVEGTFAGPLKIRYWRDRELKSKVVLEEADIRELAIILATRR